MSGGGREQRGACEALLRSAAACLPSTRVTAILDNADIEREVNDSFDLDLDADSAGALRKPQQGSVARAGGANGRGSGVLAGSSGAGSEGPRETEQGTGEEGQGASECVIA